MYEIFRMQSTSLKRNHAYNLMKGLLKGSMPAENSACNFADRLTTRQYAS